MQQGTTTGTHVYRLQLHLQGFETTDHQNITHSSLQKGELTYSEVISECEWVQVALGTDINKSK